MYFPKLKKNRDKFYIKDMFIRTIIGFVKKNDCCQSKVRRIKIVVFKMKCFVSFCYNLLVNFRGL